MRSTASTHLAALCRLLPERDPHPAIVPMVETILDHIDDAPLASALIVQFELHLLNELGFGLELDSCAVDRYARRPDLCLAEVGPCGVAAGRRAVARQAACGCRAFLSGDGAESIRRRGDIADGFALTGYFLVQRVLEPRGHGFTEARDSFVAAVLGGPRARRRLRAD